MGLWLLKLGLALAMGLTAFASPGWAKPEGNAPQQEQHHGAHAQHHMAAENADNTHDSTPDSTHCTSHADCHHCCPLAWVNWANIGKPDAPTVHPSGHVHSWHSTSWLPGLRPPKT
jgi:hypothetical protein